MAPLSLTHFVIVGAGAAGLMTARELARFEARIKELVENVADLVVLVEPLLVVRRVFASRSVSCTTAC